MPTRYAKVGKKWFAASRQKDGPFNADLQAWADQIGAAHDYAPGEVEGVEVADGEKDPRGRAKRITDPIPPSLPLPEPPLTDGETRALRALLDS
jgi:hypothetical protein